MNSLFIWREIKNHFQSHSHNDFPVTLLLFDVSPGDEACNLQASSALRSAKHEGVVAPPHSPAILVSLPGPWLAKFYPLASCSSPFPLLGWLFTPKMINLTLLVAA